MINRMSQQRTRHQEAVDRIAGWIVRGRFAAGGTLPREAEIGAELGVSRTVVREAMRTLVAKGIVTVRPRHGTRIQPMESWNLFDRQVIGWRSQAGISMDLVNDLIDFRLGIEPYAAELAAQADDFPAAALNDAFRRMERAVDGHGSYHEADLDFHTIILTGSRNQFLLHLVPLIGNALTLSFELSVLSMESARSALPMHRAVADAVIAREPAAARDALATLIRSAREDIIVGLSMNDHIRGNAHAEGDRPDLSPA